LAPAIGSITAAATAAPNAIFPRYLVDFIEFLHCRLRYLPRMRREACGRNPHAKGGQESASLFGPAALQRAAAAEEIGKSTPQRQRRNGPLFAKPLSYAVENDGQKHDTDATR